MGKKDIWALQVQRGSKKQIDRVANKGIPGRVTTKNMESLRLGEYERLAIQGPAHFKIFQNILP